MDLVTLLSYLVNLFVCYPANHHVTGI